MSMSPSDSPSSRWSFGLSIATGSPTTSRTAKSSSPPAGTPSMTTLEIAMCAAVNAVSASAWAASAAFTCSASSFARASNAGRSSGDALPTLLLAAFCSARSPSADEIAARRAASAANSASTSAGSSPRLSCERRTASGSSRSSFRSITALRLLSPVPADRQSIRPASRRTHIRNVFSPLSGAPVRMDRMSQAPEKELSQGREVESSTASTGESSKQQPAAFLWPRSLQARATRRALLLTALGGLLIAGLVTAIPVGGPGSSRFLDSSPVRSTGTKSDAALNRASTGECLMWPDTTPESARVVNCGDDHKFEVAESIDMRTFPGSEYGPNAAPPTPARIQQITQEQCEAAVRTYLGPKFDPNSKFTVSLLWPGDKAWRQNGDRRMLCGLQLPGTSNQQQVFKGKVADVDQSKVWPAGTCLGIDSATNQPTDAPVDCATPHAMEVTGTVNLGEKFPGGLPAEPDQDGFIKDSCTKMTDAFLAPVK